MQGDGWQHLRQFVFDQITLADANELLYLQ
jgi:hypothetical protein